MAHAIDSTRSSQSPLMFFEFGYLDIYYMRVTECLESYEQTLKQEAVAESTVEAAGTLFVWLRASDGSSVFADMSFYHIRVARDIGILETGVAARLQIGILRAFSVFTVKGCMALGQTCQPGLESN